ncbi:odorant receptor 46a-like [Adelges cooleyi]|uniref:odorant receptor 46a-like n=1 Tax=Adelges cooleyi TaxID=133065 RepID=UPI00217FB7E3|nr:odorant receptor 46a-like [Adelges cooleyi]
MKMIISHHQSIIEKLKSYFKYFEMMTIVQIFTSSTSLICASYVLALNYLSGELNSIQSLKVLFTIPSFSFQLFLPCYIFGNLSEKQSSIIFAIYSSNWTEMNLKSRKLVLSAMKMNNANQFNMKMTYTKLICMELFAVTIQRCYSILSMLVNTKMKSE